jgi:hypothetical protein
MMSRLPELNVKQLVELFASICIDQDDALLRLDTARYNRLYEQMRKVEDELKGRSSDQRRALEVLFHHRNLQVRLQAAQATLAVLPVAARKLLEKIAGSKKYPQAGDAGMSIVNLDRGIYKPV